MRRSAGGEVPAGEEEPPGVASPPYVDRHRQPAVTIAALWAPEGFGVLDLRTSLRKDVVQLRLALDKFLVAPSRGRAIPHAGGCCGRRDGRAGGAIPH